MSESKLPDVEWADDAKPVATCMICNSMLSVTETECAKCKVALSLVHLCPGCGRVVAAKHQRCPYCSRNFLKNDERMPADDRHPKGSGIDPGYARLEVSRRKRQRHAMIF